MLQISCREKKPQINKKKLFVYQPSQPDLFIKLFLLRPGLVRRSLRLEAVRRLTRGAGGWGWHTKLKQYQRYHVRLVQPSGLTRAVSASVCCHGWVPGQYIDNILCLPLTGALQLRELTEPGARPGHWLGHFTSHSFGINSQQSAVISQY